MPNAGDGSYKFYNKTLKNERKNKPFYNFFGQTSKLKTQNLQH